MHWLPVPDLPTDTLNPQCCHTQSLVANDMCKLALEVKHAKQGPWTVIGATALLLNGALWCSAGPFRRGGVTYE
eukprot:scaffold93085_cov33-Prasinocladus_malaysianus.AAC.1